MRMTSRVAVLTAALILALVFTVPAKEAFATCSIGGGPSDYHRYSQQAVDTAPFVFIGTVVGERSLQGGPNTTSIWESVVVPKAMLKGDLTEERVVIPYTGFLGADCSGGPRLREGEQVLIAIYRGVPSYGTGEEAWQMNGTFSKVLLRDDVATLDWVSGSQSLGPVETVIREYGALVGANESQIYAAVEAANAPATEEETSAVTSVSTDDSSSYRSQFLRVVVVTVVTVVLLGQWRRFSRRRSDTQEPTADD